MASGELTAGDVAFVLLLAVDEFGELGVRKPQLRHVSFCDRICDSDVGVDVVDARRRLTFSSVTSVARSCKGRVATTIVT